MAGWSLALRRSIVTLGRGYYVGLAFYTQDLTAAQVSRHLKHGQLKDGLTLARMNTPLRFIFLMNDRVTWSMTETGSGAEL